MKGHLGAFGLLLLSTGASATQLDTKSIAYHYPNSTEIQYRLPWFSSTDNPAAAKRINDYLFTSLLNQLPGKDPQATLNLLAKTGLDGTASLDYTVDYHRDNLLTINVLAEGCGAYCESYNLPMSFDLTSGAKISLQDVLKTEALVRMNNRIRNNIRTQINRFVAQQKALPMAEQRVEDDEVVDYEAFYANCYALDSHEIKYTDRFTIDKNRLVFLNERCSNHASRALDELGDFTSAIPVTAVKGSLTPYGKSLLLTEAQLGATPAPALSDKLLYGTLGKSMRIVLNVKCNGDYIHGNYYYEKFGTPIELSGKCSADNSQHYELTTSSQDVAKETFTLDLTGGHYQGVWTSNGKTLPVRFE